MHFNRFRFSCAEISVFIVNNNLRRHIDCVQKTVQTSGTREHTQTPMNDSRNSSDK